MRVKAWLRAGWMPRHQRAKVRCCGMVRCGRKGWIGSSLRCTAGGRIARFGDDGVLLIGRDIPEVGYSPQKSTLISEWKRVTMNGLKSPLLLAAALGDDFADDIDLYVRRGNQLIDYDENYDAAALCLFTGSSSSTTLTVTYASGTGPSLILLGVYE